MATERPSFPNRVGRVLFSPHGLVSGVSPEEGRLSTFGLKLGGEVATGIGIELYNLGFPRLAMLFSLPGAFSFQMGATRTKLLDWSYYKPYIEQMGPDSYGELPPTVEDVQDFTTVFRTCMNANPVAPHMSKEYVSELGSSEVDQAASIRLAFHASSDDTSITVNWWQYLDGDKIDGAYFFPETKKIATTIPSGISRIGVFSEFGISIHANGSVFCSSSQSVVDAHKSHGDSNVVLGEDFNTSSKDAFEKATELLRSFREKLAVSPVIIV